MGATDESSRAWLLFNGLVSTFFVLCIVPFTSQLPIATSLERGFQISPNETSLQWGSFRPFLTSPVGDFALGFDRVDVSTSFVLALMYVIWSSDASASQNTEPLSMEMVWSANANNSLSTEATSFAISPQGSLVLSDTSTGTQYWSTYTNYMGPTVLQLEDSGNLVFSPSTNNATSTAAPRIWQSFDHPTDTLLQGQNFTASMRLVAPLSSSNASKTHLQMEADGIALYADLGSKMPIELAYWTLQADQETALINPQEGPIYARMDKMGFLGMYQTEDDRISLEVFNTYNVSEVSHRRLKLDGDGNLRVYYWLNTSWYIDFQAIQDGCSLPMPCGPYGLCNMTDMCSCPAGVVNSSASIGSHLTLNANVTFRRENVSDDKQGCVLVDADSYMGDGCSLHKPYNGFFMELKGVDSLFHKSLKVSVNASSVDACEALCRANCTCTAFFYGLGLQSKCFLAYQVAEMSLLQTGYDDDLAYIKLTTAAMLTYASPSLPSQTSPVSRSGPGRASSLASQITAAIAGLLAAAAICGIVVWRYRSIRLHKDSGSVRKALLNDLPGLPPMITYRELEACASYFRSFRSAGPLGTLFEGTLSGGSCVAIARLTLQNQLDMHSVRLVLASAGHMEHRNLARLCGYSVHGAELAVAYEVPPNGWIDLAELSWNDRVEVVMGVARAMAALHEREGMMHGLLNLEAILVGDRNVAKVVGLGVGELVASGLAAAPPNMATKYSALPPKLAVADDVYQFGVVLTELLTGQRVSNGASWRNRWRDAIGAGQAGQLLDKAIGADVDEDMVVRLGTSAGLCLHPATLQRPTMATVLRLLEGSLRLPLI